MNLQIRGKLLTGFLAISIIFLVAGTLSIISINNLKREILTVTSRDVPTLDAVTQVYIGVTSAKIKLEEALSNKNANTKSEIEVNLNKALWFSKAVLYGDKNSQFTYIPSNSSLIRQNTESFQNDIQELKNLSSDVLKGEEEKHTQFNKIFDRAIFAIKDTKKFIKGNMDSRIDTMDNSYISSSIILIIAITLSFVVSVVTGWILSNSISIPLREITFRLRDISNGNFNQKSLNSQTRDEVGILTTIYNRMLNKLSDFVTQADRIAIGDFSADFSLADSDDSLSQSFSRMTNRLRVVSELATQVADGNTDISIRELSDKDTLAQSINKMTKSIKLAISELKIKESNIDNLPTPVIAVDTDMNITFINKAGAKLKRKTPKDLIGAKCYEVFNASHCNTDNCCVCKSLVSGKEENGEMVIDTEFLQMPVTYSSSPIKDEEGNIIGALEYITDITNIKNLITENHNKIDELTKENDKKVWYQKGLTGIHSCLREAETVTELSNKICEYLAKYLDTHVLTFYNKENESFKLSGSYAFNVRKSINSSFNIGEGLIGQAAKEKKNIILTNVPEDYLSIKSSLGEVIPKNLAIIPLIYKKSVKGVIEIGTLTDFTKDNINFLNDISEPVAIALNRLATNSAMKIMLEKSQDLTEELRASNEDLEEQTITLQTTQAQLELNQAEIESANKDLEEQKIKVDETYEKLLIQTEQLEKSNKYKSEFLANMSHELRTPLNSILVLSSKLSKNKEKTLTDKQMTNATIINECGNDLLNMINDILDISKIEAGHMSVDPQEINLENVVEIITKNFTQFANEKGLDFNIEVDETAPKLINNDVKKIKQIIKNLLSNALKFTSSGYITLKFYTPENNKGLEKDMLCIEVKDSGIGISKEKQKIIFEAFKQENGSITREFGGTGLGLSISKRICELLGGKLELKSIQGEGSTFTAYIKKDMQAIKEDKQQTSPTILIIEDSKKVSHTLEKVCIEKGYSAIFTNSSLEALNIIENQKPDGIILNIKIKDGKAIELMDKLKDSDKNKDIPLHLINSSNFKNSELTEKVVDEVLLFLDSSDKMEVPLAGKKVLLVDDDVRNLYSIEESLRDLNMEVLKATDGEMAIKVLQENPKIDLILMDIMMPVMDGYQSMKKIRSIPKISNIPIIAITAKVMPGDREKCIDAGANDYLSKPVSIDKLIQKTGLWVSQ